MLTRWILENFKPFLGPLDIPLRRVTVFAGLNSSGKSSMLQSMLMVAQTLQHQNLERPVVFNGPFVQLGPLEKVRSDQAKTPGIAFGFDLQLPARRPHGDENPVISSRTRVVPSEQPDRDAESSDPARPTIQDGTFAAKSLGLDFNFQPLCDSDQAAMKGSIAEEYLHLLPELSREHMLVRQSSDEGDIQHIAHLNHFVPDRLLSRFNLKEQQSQVREAIEVTIFDAQAFGDPHPPTFVRVQDLEVSEVVENYLRKGPASQRLLDRVCQDQHFLSDLKRVYETEGILVGAGSPFRKAPDVFARIHEKRRGKKKKEQLLESVRELFLKHAMRIFQERTGVSYGIESHRQQEILQQISIITLRYFTESIRYLGPLRTNESVAKGFASSDKLDDVGLRGEFAAAAYDSNRQRKIRYYDPHLSTLHTATLAEAVDSWARYLGVAHHISAQDSGLSGLSWSVQTNPEGSARPLHFVGVGVSQVLPVLVAGLLAPAGTTLIMEQPELHLHARAQARLGDFFYGLALCGKQSILETHSDCLIKQLRYHLVKGGVAAREDIAIYFVEQDPKGVSQVKEIEISPNGNIVNWPDGFCDEAIQQEENISRAAMMTRAGRTQG